MVSIATEHDENKQFAESLAPPDKALAHQIADAIEEAVNIDAWAECLAIDISKGRD